MEPIYAIESDYYRIPERTIIKLRDDPEPTKQRGLAFHLLLASNAVRSIIGLILIFILLAIPISMLIIGVQYRDRSHCTIEPQISLFLIVFGSVGLAYLVLSFILSLIIMFINYIKSTVTFVGVTIFGSFLLVMQLFLIAWVICGCVWTFSIYNKVQYTNQRRWRTYCNITLYFFTFIYLIVIMALWLVQLIIRIALAVYRSRK